MSHVDGFVAVIVGYVRIAWFLERRVKLVVDAVGGVGGLFCQRGVGAMS